MQHYFKLDVSHIPGSNDGEIQFVTAGDAINIAKLASSTNDNASVKVLEVTERYLVAGNVATPIE